MDFTGENAPAISHDGKPKEELQLTEQHAAMTSGETEEETKL